MNTGCSKMKQLGQDEAIEARMDKITGRDHKERKKCFSKRESPTRTGNLPSYVAESQPKIFKIKKRRVEAKPSCSSLYGHHSIDVRSMVFVRL